MADIIKQLEFKVLLNKKQKQTKDWEATIMSPEIMYELSSFLSTKVGQAWLKSAEGQDFTKWQNG